MLICRRQEYPLWIATLEEGSEAKRKMAGIVRYGEIVIDSSHVVMLANTFSIALKKHTKQQQSWSQQMLNMLSDIHQESAIYLMVRSEHG